jgi:hypothetical protein
VVRRADEQADAPVAQGAQVHEGPFDRGRVVRRHLRESHLSAQRPSALNVGIVDRRVQQHDRHTTLQQLLVFLRAKAAAEHHAGDLLVQQHRHVLGLGQPAGGARTQHRRETELHQCAADDLRERREDRILQLGHHQPDQSGAHAAKLRGTLVAEYIQGGEHRLPGGVRDTALVVEHPADRRLAHADFSGHFGESARHNHIMTWHCGHLPSSSSTSGDLRRTCARHGTVCAISGRAMRYRLSGLIGPARSPTRHTGLSSERRDLSSGNSRVLRRQA